MYHLLISWAIEPPGPGAMSMQPKPRDRRSVVVARPLLEAAGTMVHDFGHDERRRVDQVRGVPGAPVD